MIKKRGFGPFFFYRLIDILGQSDYICSYQLHTTTEETDMTHTINGKTYNVKETNGKFFYWSPRAIRWLPVKKSEVSM